MIKFLVFMLMFVAPTLLGQEAKKVPSTTAAAVSTPANPNADVVLTVDNTLDMRLAFDEESTSRIAKKAKELDARIPANDSLFLVLDSPGGSIDYGIELINNLNALNRPVKTITIFSASMGFQTVQGLQGERLLTKKGTLMAHKAKGTFRGEFPGQFDNRYQYYLKRVLSLDAEVVKRTNGRHTAASYAALIENEYWCEGQDCINDGFADKIVTATCDKSLAGTINIVYDRFMYRGRTIEIVDTKSVCPLITGVLGFNIYVDGVPLFSSNFDGDKGNVARKDRYSLVALDLIDSRDEGDFKQLIENKLKSRRMDAQKEIIRY